MADKKISELDLALRINNDAVIPFSQDNGGEPTSFKGLITQIGSKIAEDMTFSNLQTTSKTLVGAINELLSLGNPIILGTTAPSSSVGKDGNLYIQYTIGTGGADDTVDDIFIKINGAWCEIQTGGAGGHTIVDNGGTDLAQRTNLQFKGAYSEDNSTDDTTEVFIVRSMTRAQFENLSAAEKVGLINITDESLNATELPISASDSTNTKDYIDSGLSGKADNNDFIGTYSTSGLTTTSGVTINEGGYFKFGNIVIVNIRFTLSGSKQGGDSLITNFPKPIATNNNIACGSTNASGSMVMGSYGALVTADNITSGPYIASCVYLAE